MPAFLIILFSAICFRSFAQDADINKLAEKFRAISDYKAIRADFLQTRYLKDLDMHVKIHGEMICEKNGRLRWEVKSPIRSITIIGSTELKHFDRETGKTAMIQSDKIPWLQILKNCMGDWISGDPDRLSRRFELLTKDDHTFRLFPKETQLKTIFKTVEIRADVQFRGIESITIEEKSGDQLEIRFIKVQKNPVLPEKLWQMPSS